MEGAPPEAAVGTAFTTTGAAAAIGGRIAEGVALGTGAPMGLGNDAATTGAGKGAFSLGGSVMRMDSGEGTPGAGEVGGVSDIVGAPRASFVAPSNPVCQTVHPAHPRLKTTSPLPASFGTRYSRGL